MTIADPTDKEPARVFSAETRRQAAAFDAIGERYDDVFPHKSGQIIATQWVVDRLPPGGRVLDLGCGTGVPTAGMLAESGLEVVGVDVSAEMLALARRNVPTGRFVAMDLLELDSSLGRVRRGGRVLLAADAAPRRDPAGAAPGARRCSGRAGWWRSGWWRATSTTPR